MPTIKERRKVPRSHSSLPLDIYDAKGRAVLAEGQCVDLSTMGVRLISRKPFKRNSAIRLHLVPSAKPVLDIVGKVIWSRKVSPGFEYGVRFHGKPLEPLS